MSGWVVLETPKGREAELGSNGRWYGCCKGLDFLPIAVFGSKESGWCCARRYGSVLVGLVVVTFTWMDT